MLATKVVKEEGLCEIAEEGFMIGEEKIRITSKNVKYA